MIIKVLMIFFIVFLLALAYTLWSHSDKKFLIYSPNENLTLKNIMRFTAILLVLVSILGIVILIIGSEESNLITLLLGSLIAAAFSIYLANIR
ncbi:hypothetical protein COSHB9_19950 [Companilactobacillus alimentarius]|uniref:DUF3784 domain-containing protein n=1 Tax=Companilactobacillus alimentarius DSM 20249 TaxID=1423720 RepID=A0A2K9HN84_9LACO|nr:hypothetical protein [Companilactobacillus alimentarius]AUI72745.1 hypothetical protein LA20249_01535 [Companilactobacillus alimentarius DSM 20249]MDT6951793.1 hypothetical protein [Companilactobacillus alimentarius]GEO44155.1 hypothetical protein LAL01_03870 [Companilactobacillus alimentarius]